MVLDLCALYAYLLHLVANIFIDNSCLGFQRGKVVLLAFLWSYGCLQRFKYFNVIENALNAVQTSLSKFFPTPFLNRKKKSRIERKNV